jgi:glycosyltransferase involved in cell wall biosynthesis
MARKSILIAHPGATSLLYPLVGILRGLDVELAFHTSYIYRPGDTADRLAGLLPGSLRERARRQLSRRSHPDVDPVVVHRHPMGEIAYLAANRLASAAFGQRMLRLRNDRFDGQIAAAVRQAPPDLYIGFDGSSLFALRACRDAGVPSMMFQAIGHIDAGHALLGEERRRHPQFTHAAVEFDTPSWRERNASEALLADHIVVPSTFVRDTLIAAGRPDRGIHLLPYPVDTTRFTPATPSGGRGLRVLFAGHVGMRQGVVYALEAIRALGRDDIRLTLVGTATDGTAWLEPYRGLFEHIPGVPYAEMPRLFQAADAFVFPSLFEGSAMVVNEALASALPAIVTANSGSIVRDGVEGFVVPIRDSAAIADRLAQLADDPALRARMAAAARARAEAHDFAAYRTAFSGLIERVAR